MPIIVLLSQSPIYGIYYLYIHQPQFIFKKNSNQSLNKNMTAPNKENFGKFLLVLKY